MSRFTNYSPKAEKSETVVSNTAAEDEIIQAILRKRQQRIASTRLHESSTNFGASTGSSTSNDSVQFPSGELSTPSRKHESTEFKTPYNLLKRLARTSLEDRGPQLSTMEECLEEEARALYAGSVTSHTTASIEEAVALVSQHKSQSTPSLKNQLSFIPAIDLERNSPETKDISPFKPPSNSIATPANGHEKANRILFTPDTDRGRPKSQEVAQGYISPPASNRTSPKVSGGTKLISPFGTPHKLLYQSSSSEVSPTPNQVQRTPVSQPSTSPDDTKARQTFNTCPSPRSRLARTLLEIQSELADSREGIEAIEVRLDILEKQAPLDRNLLTKHVEDCIRDMAQSIDDSIDITLDSEGIEDGFHLPPVDTSADQVSQIATETETYRPGIRIPWTGKAIFYGILGTIAAEWLIMAALDEFGRRQGFMSS